ncbi:ABC transporter ATP-binding protein [Aggregatilinea lenta]|uniref:ABC transporter ATP-binding protein n=1 Tax=Aggregatilinea lenta TaxID=913108 RepID=UPI000E5B0F5A|nr:ABC transporter ATP-binding protein [Aggregatilinea lenta]
MTNGHEPYSSSLEPVISLSHVHRIYHLAGEDIHAVNDVTLDVWPHQMTAIVGRSGSGKTTLLNLMAGLDTPSGGDIRVLGRSLMQMDERERLDLRLRHLGFIFQTFGLMPLLSARENVGVPLRMRGADPAERETRIDEALTWVGLGERAHHRPYELSGGEQQRVAIARALAEGPSLVLADEPTGQLDTRTGRRILDLLRRLVEERGVTLLIVTHDPQVMAEADVVHELSDGALIETRVKAGVTVPGG